MLNFIGNCLSRQDDTNYKNAILQNGNGAFFAVRFCHFPLSLLSQSY